MGTITHDFLKRRASTVFKSSSLIFHEQVLLNSVKDSARRSSFDIFLSHAFLDASEVLYLKDKLEKMGYSVFVDWIEYPELDRSHVTEENVKIIRDAMQKCKVMIYSFSDNAKKSVWMPWELGFFDGFSGYVCILPVTDYSIDDESYEGVEFLAIYPFITLTQSKDGTYNYYINHQNGKYDLLNKWIKEKVSKKGVLHG